MITFVNSILFKGFSPMKARIKKTKGFEPSIPNCLTLQKIISGGQVGVDIAALKAAKKWELKTGGSMPEGYVTLAGNKPGYSWKYRLNDDCPNYKIRTWKNVEQSDATLRIATNFNSRGEVCTLNAIRHYHKPHLDVFFEPSECYFKPPEEIAVWLVSLGVKVLNVAGNANPELELKVELYITDVLNILKWG